MNIQETRKRIAQAQQSVMEYKVFEESLEKNVIDFSNAIREVEEMAMLDRKAGEVIRRVESLAQMKQINDIVNVVNIGLSSLFSDKVKFKVNELNYQDADYLEFALVKDGFDEDIEQSGGGLKDLISLLCRIFVVCSLYPKNKRILMLDEPISALSVKYRRGFVDLVQSLATKLGMQLIITTHMEQLISDKFKVYEAKPTGNGTEFITN